MGDRDHDDRNFRRTFAFDALFLVSVCDFGCFIKLQVTSPSSWHFLSVYKLGGKPIPNLYARWFGVRLRCSNAIIATCACAGAKFFDTICQIILWNQKKPCRHSVTSSYSWFSQIELWRLLRCKLPTESILADHLRHAVIELQLSFKPFKQMSKSGLNKVKYHRSVSLWIDASSKSHSSGALLRRGLGLRQHFWSNDWI